MVQAYKDENVEHLLKRFKLEVERAGILKEYRKHEFFISPSHLKYAKKRALDRKRMLVKIRKEMGKKHRYKLMKLKSQKRNPRR